MQSVEPAHAPGDRLDRAEPPGGAHPPRALVRARPRQQGGQLLPRQRGVDLRQRRRGDPRRLPPALGGRPEGAGVRRLHRARPPADDDLHAAQQDGGAAQRLHRARRRLQARHARAAQGDRQARAPRRHRQAVRRHLRRAAQAERRRHPPVRPGHRQGRRVDRHDRRDDHRHGRPPAPRRQAGDRRELRPEGEPVPERRARLRRHADAEVRRDRPQRAAVRGLPDRGHPPGVARADPQGRPDPDLGHLREQGPRLVRRDDPRGHVHRREGAAQGPLQAAHHRQGARRSGRTRPRACPTAPGASHEDPWCGEQYGKEPCDRPEPAEPPAEVRTNT